MKRSVFIISFNGYSFAVVALNSKIGIKCSLRSEVKGSASIVSAYFVAIHEIVGKDNSVPYFLSGIPFKFAVITFVILRSIHKYYPARSLT